MPAGGGLGPSVPPGPRFRGTLRFLLKGYYKGSFKGIYRGLEFRPFGSCRKLGVPLKRSVKGSLKGSIRVLERV